tara:strand:- start:412 stop:720 length:309 start_codon:yes stop_codon:yes gene_type:complete
MIKFVEVLNDTDFNPRMERTAQLEFSLNEVWINEKYVVSFRAASGYKKLLREGRLPEDLNQSHDFTAILTNNGNINETHVVVGDVESVARRLRVEKRSLLKG